MYVYAYFFSLFIFKSDADIFRSEKGRTVTLCIYIYIYISLHMFLWCVPSIRHAGLKGAQDWGMDRSYARLIVIHGQGFGDSAGKSIRLLRERRGGPGMHATTDPRRYTPPANFYDLMRSGRFARMRADRCIDIRIFERASFWISTGREYSLHGLDLVFLFLRFVFELTNWKE